MADKQIRLSDKEAGEMLDSIAEHDRRTRGNVVALLIRDRYAELFSQPSDALVSQAARLNDLVPTAE